MKSLAENPVLDARFSGYRGLDLVRGEGSYVFDTKGRRYLDATSMYGVAVVGHAHPVLTEALVEQSRRMISCFASFGNPVREELLQSLGAWLAPLDRFFLCNSGTEAVEAALKIARASTGRSGVVALSGAFHGRTMGALSATFRGRHREAFQPLLDGVRHVRPGDATALEKSIDDRVGLILVECVQGEGGVRLIDPDFLRQAQHLAHQRGALFAVDEVQTGFGRTGRDFSYQHVGLQPDLVCLAKAMGGGVPIGALAFRSERAGLESGAHGSTFGGNPLACAAGLAVLQLLENEDLVRRSAQHGKRLLDLLCCQLSTGEAPIEVRGQGLMIGIELKDSAVPVQKRLQERGYLVLGAGPRVIRLLPPLNTPWNDLQQLADAIVEEVLR